MESKENNIDMLNMFTHPVFQVKDGIIYAANRSAQSLQIAPDTSVFDILQSGQDEYRNFTGGSISLTIKAGPLNHIAAVVRTDNGDYFHLIAGNESADLQALALASQQLRDPLSNIIALSDSLYSIDADSMDDKKKFRVAQLNQNLHRLLKSVGNMSDVYQLGNRGNTTVMVNIISVLQEAVETVKQHLDNADINLELSTNSCDCIGLADQDQLERAVFNLLSNAVRHGDPCNTVQVTIRSDKARIHFAVENSCKDITPEMLGTIFFRYRRTPSVTDGSKGLGLGIPMVQAIASAHKGSLLVTLPSPGKIRFSLTIPVIHAKGGNFRSPVICPDYTGGHARSLIELSDILPASAYEK